MSQQDCWIVLHCVGSHCCWVDKQFISRYGSQCTHSLPSGETLAQRGLIWILQVQETHKLTESQSLEWNDIPCLKHGISMLPVIASILLYWSWCCMLTAFIKDGLTALSSQLFTISAAPDQVSSTMHVANRLCCHESFASVSLSLLWHCGLFAASPYVLPALPSTCHPDSHAQDTVTVPTFLSAPCFIIHASL